MTLSIRVQRIDIVDDDGVGPIKADVHTITTSDDPAEAALGFATKSDVRRCVLTRPAFNALIGALRRPNTDNWPDVTLAHPITKAP